MREDEPEHSDGRHDPECRHRQQESGAIAPQDHRELRPEEESGGDGEREHEPDEVELVEDPERAGDRDAPQVARPAGHHGPQRAQERRQFEEQHQGDRPDVQRGQRDEHRVGRDHQHEHGADHAPERAAGHPIGQPERERREQNDRPADRRRRHAEGLEDGKVEVRLERADIAHQHDGHAEQPLGDEEPLGRLAQRRVHEQHLVVLETGNRDQAAGAEEEQGESDAEERGGGRPLQDGSIHRAASLA